MRIAIFGAGGVGGYFGARLAAGGSDVTFVARGPHLDAMRARGLRVTSPAGDIEITNVSAVADAASLGPTDLVIVGVKLWDTEAAATALRPLAEQGATIVSFQNGVDKDEILGRHLPSASIMGGVCYIAAVIAEPGVIAHTGSMQRLVFGEYDGRPSQRADAFLQACLAAGIDAAISDEIERLIWEKYVLLVGLSATTSTIRQPIGPIREDERARTFLLEVMREVVAVGRAKGIRLAEDFAAERLAFCDTLPAGMTSSMFHDLERGNRLELPWLSGAVAEFSRQLGIPTPANRAVADILNLYALGRK